jgi:hypothetical protein
MRLREYVRVLNNQRAFQHGIQEHAMFSTDSEVVAGIDVHKAMLAVVVARPGQNETEYVSRKFGAGPWQVRELIDCIS